jgi:hypothetical protein
MKKRYLVTIIAAAAMGLALPTMASAYKQNHGMGYQSTTVQLAKMELELQLQDQQLPAWNAYKQQMQTVAQARKSQMNNMRERMKQARDGNTMDATARLDLKAEMLQAEHNRLTQAKSATEALLKQLSPSQQTVFNAQMHAGGAKGGHFERSGGGMGKRDRAACNS